MLDYLDIPDDLLPSTVDIYPATVGQDYASQPAQQAIPCNAQPRLVEEIFDEQQRISRVRRYHVFFNDNPNVSVRDKMIVQQPDGSTHTLFVEVDRDEGGMGAYFVIRAIERL